MNEAVGGRARLRVILLLGAVLGLDGADKATVGAVAAELEHSLGVGNTDIGLLVTASTGVAALASLPLGLLADRIHRVRMLTAAILLWSLAMVLGCVAPSYGVLLVSRLALGTMIAAAGPAVASLTGDHFPAAERGRMYGFILAGELLGGGLGFLVSGEIAAVLGWRSSFAVLALAGFVLAPLVARCLPEPRRGGQLPSPERARGDTPPTTMPVRPREAQVLTEDPAARSLWWAVGYVLSIRTNVLLIVASGLGWFFITGMQTFAVVFSRGRFGLGQAAASSMLFVVGVGAIAGILVGGRLADRLVTRGHPSARPTVAGIGYLVAMLLFLPGLLSTDLLVAAPLFFLAAVGLGGANPPLDAARLDLMHYRLWGRAEAVRTVLRNALTALAPLFFGVVSTWFGGRASSYAAGGPETAVGSSLARTFLVSLAALLVAGVLLCWRARRSYPQDVATALESERRTRGH